MKEITIKGQTYPLKIGLSFIAELDNKYKHSFGEVEFGWGVGKMFLLLSQFNAVAIVDFIRAATNTLTNQPTVDDIETLFDEWKAEDVIETCNAFLDLLGTSSLTKAQVAQIGMMGIALAQENELKS